MIQLAHVAAGALAARGKSGVLDAALAGLTTHALIDVVPHGEVHDDAFEATTAIASVVLIAMRHGLRSPITWGAVGGVSPDLEHVIPPAVRPRKRVFPTHRFAALHGWETKPLAIPAWAQAVIGGAVIGAIVARVADRHRDAPI